MTNYVAAWILTGLLAGITRTAACDSVYLEIDRERITGYPETIHPVA